MASTTGANASVSVTTASAPATAGSNWVASYVGAKAQPADKSLPPVVIGYVNMEGGTTSFPGAHAAATAAVDYLNDYANGINGHPIQLAACAGETPADMQACGTKLANMSNLSFVVLGDIVTDDTPLYQALGGSVPIVQSAALTKADFGVANAVNYGPGLIGVYNALALLPKASGIATGDPIVILNHIDAASTASQQLVSADLKAAGFTNIQNAQVATNILVPDVVSALQSVNIGKAKALVMLGPVQMCIAANSALKSLQASPQLVMSTEACLDSAFTSQVNNGLPNGWKVVAFASSAIAPSASDGTEAFVSALKQYSPSTNPSATGANQSFGAIISAAKVADQVGSTNSQALLSALKSFPGPAALQPGPMKCGHLSAAPTICGTQVASISYSNGQWTQNSISVAG